MKQKSIKIFLSADDTYAPFIATTVISICSKSDALCEFIVLDGGISNDKKEKILEIKHSYKNFSIEFFFLVFFC